MRLAGLTEGSRPCCLPKDLSPDLLTSVFLVTGPVPGVSRASHLVPGIRRVHSLLVTAGFQQDPDGVQLQEHLTGHCVKEGDVGKGRRGQQEDFPR